MIGCLLIKPQMPGKLSTAPSPLPQTPGSLMTIEPYSEPTGQSMKATTFAQFEKKRPLDLFRKKPDPVGLIMSLPGIFFFILGVGFILHYIRVIRRRWDVFASIRGFNGHVSVVRGTQAIQAAKGYYQFGCLYLMLGIPLIILGLILVFFDLF
jgi:hypothetical protein